MYVKSNRFNCDDPYYLLDKEDLKMAKFEKEMNQLLESASLFELNVPEFKYLKQCQRELRMLKVLNIFFNSCIFFFFI